MSSAVSARRAWPVVAVAVTLAILAGLLNPLAASASTVALTGKATTQAGKPLASIEVTMLASTADHPVIATSKTTASGSFSFPSIPTGTYVMHFGASATTYAQYLGGSSKVALAQELTLATGFGGTNVVTAVLESSGTVAGKVTTTARKGLPKYTVRAYSEGADGTWAVVASTLTAKNGSYALAGLEPGAYRLETLNTLTSPTYAPLFSGGATTMAAATSVRVTASTTTPVSFALGKSGSIAGTVTGRFASTSVESLAGVTVTPYRLGGSTAPWDSATAIPSRSTVTKANGSFTVTGLAPGNYTLEFAPRVTAPLPTSTTIYGRTFLGLKDSATLASSVHLGSATVSKKNSIELLGGATLSGVVADGLSNPVSSVRVSVDHPGASVDAPRAAAFTTTTDDSGHYSFSGLGTGDWMLYVGSFVDADLSDPVAENTTLVRTATVVPSLTASEARIVNVTGALRTSFGTTTSPALSAPNGWKVGEEVTASVGTWSPSAGNSFDVQWFAGFDAIPGATELTHRLSPSDVYESLHVEVTATNFGYGTTTVNSMWSPSVQPGAAPTVVSAATVTGLAQVGQRLTVTPGSWSIPGTVVTYTWQRTNNGSYWYSVSDSSPSHLVTPQDVNAQLRVAVHATRAGHAPADTIVDVADAVVPGTFTRLSPTSVSKKGAELTVKPATWTGPGESVFTWKISRPDGSNAYAWGTSLTVTPYPGASITVQETRVGSGYTPLKGNLVIGQVGASPALIDTISVSGTPRVGATLQVSEPSFQYAVESVSYQWKYLSGSAWKSIQGATSSSYIPTVGDLGRTLAVEFTPVLSGFAATTSRVSSSGPVTIGDAAVPSSGPDAPSIIGTVGSNYTVTALPGVWTPTPATLSYAWSYGETASGPRVAIAGGTTSSLTIPVALEGKYLSVTIAGTKPGHTPGVMTIEAGIVTAGHLSMTTAPTASIAGTVLTATDGEWNPGITEDTTVVRKWWIYNSAGVPIYQTNSPSLNLANAGALNRPIALEVQVNRPGYAMSTSGLIPVRKGTFQLTGSINPTTADASGFAPVDTAITAPVLDWGLQSPTLSYAWQYLAGSTWKTIPGATGASFTPVGATYLGKSLRVLTSASAERYTPTTSTSTAVTVIAAPAALPGSAQLAPSISGYPMVGGTVTASPGTWDTAGLSFSYQWKSSTDGVTFTAIPGATKASLMVSEALYAKKIRFAITATRAGHVAGTSFSAVSSTVAKGNLSLVTAPKVKIASGKYTASAGSWSAKPTGVTYLWEVIDPTTEIVLTEQGGATFTPTAAHAGLLITLTASVSRTGYWDSQASVVARSVGKITPVTPLSVSGLATVGSTLTAESGEWSTTGLSLDYQWYANGTAIKNATQSTYLQSSADLGRTISVAFIPAKRGYAAAAYKVAREVTTAATAPTATVIPVISGSPELGTSLTVSAGTWSVAGVTLSYQWLRDGVPIVGATGTRYIAETADQKKDLSVTVTARKQFYPVGTATSEPRSIADLGWVGWTTDSVISGSGAFGTSITLSAQPAWTLPVSQFYVWQRKSVGSAGWDDLPGAGSTSLLLDASTTLAAGDTVRLLVKAFRPGYHANTAVSNELVIQ